jgi:UPF0716 family protein affecting phage T7 exclusion
MDQLIQIAKALGGMPTIALIVLVILAGFALAAYAIWAVVKMSGKGSHGK